MAALVATCAPENIDASGVCTSVVWVEETHWLPELTHEDAGLIGGAIFGLLAVSYLLRVARR